MTQRREVMKAMGITAIAGLCGMYPRITAAQTAKTSDITTTPYTVPPLPYAYDALEPYIDAQTMHLHHDKHHAAYVKNLNAGLADHPDLAKLPVDDLVKHLDRVPETIRAAVTVVRDSGGNPTEIGFRRLSLTAGLGHHR